MRAALLACVMAMASCVSQAYGADEEDEDMAAGTPARFPGAVGIAASKNSLQRMSGGQDEKYGKIDKTLAPFAYTLPPTTTVTDGVLNPLLSFFAYADNITDGMIAKAISFPLVKTAAGAHTSRAGVAIFSAALTGTSGDSNAIFSLLSFASGDVTMSTAVGTKRMVQINIPQVVLSGRRKYLVGVFWENDAGFDIGGYQSPYVSSSLLDSFGWLQGTLRTDASGAYFFHDTMGIGATSNQLAAVNYSPLLIIVPKSLEGHFL